MNCSSNVTLDCSLQAAKAYYLLGAKNEQYAVYHGVQFVPNGPAPNYYDYSTMPISGSEIPLSKNSDTKYNDYNICPIMYPAEYIVYGVRK